MTNCVSWLIIIKQQNRTSARQTNLPYIGKFTKTFNKDSRLKEQGENIITAAKDWQALTLDIWVVTLFTTWYNIKIFFIILPDYIHVFCVDLVAARGATIPLHSTKWMVLITEMESVYCAVRAESLYIIQVDFHLWCVKVSLQLYRSKIRLLRFQETRKPSINNCAPPSTQFASATTKINIKNYTSQVAEYRGQVGIASGSGFKSLPEDRQLNLDTFGCYGLDSRDILVPWPTGTEDFYPQILMCDGPCTILITEE